jgi:hypothetical protein
MDLPYPRFTDAVLTIALPGRTAKLRESVFRLNATAQGVVPYWPDAMV